MRRFRKISVEELLKMIPMASNIVILEENGDGWYWMSDYVTDRFENATILIEEPEITKNTEDAPKKQEVVALPEAKEPVKKCDDCRYNDGNVHAECVVDCDAQEETAPEETSPVAEEQEQAELKKTPEEDLFDRINKLSASSKKEQESVDPEKCLAIIKAYLSGKNIKDVAKESGVTQQIVKEVLIQNGTPLRVSRAFYKSIRQAAEDGRALEDIAADFHTDVDHIREIIDGGKE